MIWPNPFFFCLFTSLPYCNRHLYNHLLLLHTSYIYSRCTICLVKNNNNKKIRIEKLTKRFLKKMQEPIKVFFCFFVCFLVFVLLYSVSIFVVDTHTHTDREDSIFWLYVCNTCVCVCVLCLEIFVYPPAFRIYFDRHETKKDNWIIVHGLSLTTYYVCISKKKTNSCSSSIYIIYIEYWLVKRVYCCIYIYGVNKIERYYIVDKERKTSKKKRVEITTTFVWKANNNNWITCCDTTTI